MDLRVADIRPAEGCLPAAARPVAADTADRLKAARPAVAATVDRRKVARQVAAATVDRRKVARPAVATEVRRPAASVVRLLAAG